LLAGEVVVFVDLVEVVVRIALERERMASAAYGGGGGVHLVGGVSRK
jgi:hypothetical protein